ncbi:hypothetical protein [Marinobacterium aestuarii]|uniref:hypothetical protein n=1 Tax=Marinobacterium aestuarii TaxID=1821621 RepID=UPI000AD2C2D6|nr:hypothetical protein [Marinobacterium aestuarii]
MNAEISFDDSQNGRLDEAEVLELYRANQWSAADKPAALVAALQHSHSLVCARIDGRLVG